MILLLTSVIFWLWCSSFTSLPDPRQILTCGTFYSLTIGSSNISTLLLTMASIDRVLVILCPSRYSIFVTRRKALIKILSIILLVLLLFVHYHQSFSFSPSMHVCEYYSYAHLSHGHIWPLIRVILLAFVPCMIICLCSVIILKNRYERRLSVRKETVSAKHMRAASLMLVIYSIYYTLSIMPLNILQFFHSFFLEHTKVQSGLEIHCLKFSQWGMLMKFCVLLMLMNYSSKFFFHCFISIRFRRDAWNLVTKCSYVPEKFRSKTWKGLNIVVIQKLQGYS